MSRLLATLLVAVLTATACTADEDSSPSPIAKRRAITQATPAELEAAGLNKLPLAPEGDRVDLTQPSFSRPTDVTNALFPISRLHSAILNGTVDGKRFKVETTLLPETRIIEWPDGERIEALVSQYVAYLDGRIEEVALDFYAQADDGSVWYLGEDVYNYASGLIADTEGTWIAGKEGPGAMIMPAHPELGDAYRPENVPGLVFEEVTVKAVGETVNGPRGLVDGVLIAEELHQDGAREDKTFAPGYGEFFTGSGGDVEALALAVPTDALPEEPPAQLETLRTSAIYVFEQAEAKNWRGAANATRTLARSWETFKTGEVPPRLEPVTSAAIKALSRAVEARDRSGAQQTAIDVAQAALDLELRHRPPAEIDRARFELWVRQLSFDTKAKNAAGASGDLATLEWIRDRFVHTLDQVDVVRIDTLLVELRSKLTDEDLRGAAAGAEQLRQVLGG